MTLREIRNNPVTVQVHKLLKEYIKGSVIILLCVFTPCSLLFPAGLIYDVGEKAVVTFTDGFLLGVQLTIYYIFYHLIYLLYTYLNSLYTFTGYILCILTLVFIYECISLYADIGVKLVCKMNSEILIRMSLELCVLLRMGYYYDGMVRVLLICPDPLAYKNLILHPVLVYNSLNACFLLDRKELLCLLLTHHRDKFRSPFKGIKDNIWVVNHPSYTLLQYLFNQGIEPEMLLDLIFKNYICDHHTQLRHKVMTTHLYVHTEKLIRSTTLLSAILPTALIQFVLLPYLSLE